MILLLFWKTPWQSNNAPWKNCLTVLNGLMICLQSWGGMQTSLLSHPILTMYSTLSYQRQYSQSGFKSFILQILFLNHSRHQIKNGKFGYFLACQSNGLVTLVAFPIAIAISNAISQILYQYALTQQTPASTFTGKIVEISPLLAKRHLLATGISTFSRPQHLTYISIFREKITDFSRLKVFLFNFTLG